MKNRRLFLTTAFVTTALVVVLSASGIAIAEGSGDKHCGKHGDRLSEQHLQKKLERMTKNLGLDENQRQQVQAVMHEHRNTMKPLMEKKKTIRKSLRNLDPVSPDYDSQLATYAGEKSELVRQITLAKGQKRKAITSILTPGQLEAKRKMRLEHTKQAM